MWVAVCVVVAFEEAEEMVVEEANWVAGGRPILHMLNNLGFWCSCSQRPQEQPQSKSARPPPTHYHKQLHVQVCLIRMETGFRMCGWNEGGVGASWCFRQKGGGQIVLHSSDWPICVHMFVFCAA